MSEHLTVSVVIPAFNAARYLEEAIAGVLAQGDFPIELIVVDDGSTDGTAEVAQRFGAALTYMYQPNGGIAAALNQGVAHAHGEWLAFCAADDLWTQGRLEKQLAAFDANPALDLVFGHAQNFFSPELGAEITER